MRQGIRAVFLDFDGTIVDSEPLHYDCWNKAVQPYGGGMPWDEYTQRLTGVTDRRAAEILLSEAGHEPTDELVQRAWSAKKRLFNRRFRQELSISDPIKSWIDQAYSYLSLGVVSSSLTSEVEPILVQEDIRSRLHVLVCGDNVTHHKPHPEPYLLALNRLNDNGTHMEPADCLVLEDSESGVQAARAAGMHVRQVSGPEDTMRILSEYAKSRNLSI